MKKLILSVFMAAFAVAAIGQNLPKGYQHDVNASYDRVYERGPYLTNRFFDNVFLGVGGGVNLYMGEADAKGDLGDRLAPALDVNLGKWITPGVGLRAQYSGLKVKGFYNEFGGGYMKGELNDDNLFEKEFNSMTVFGDVLWNISNGIGGYKETRFWDFVPFIGFGYAKSEKDDVCYEGFAGRVGLLNVLRISNVIDVTLEARMMMVNSGFERAAVTRKDWNALASLTAGLQFNFGPKGGFKRATAYVPADYTPYNQRIRSLEGELGDAKNRINDLNKQLADARNKPAQVVEKDLPVSMQVFFRINSAVVQESDMLNLERIAKTIKADSNKKYSIIGYADNTTGNPRINNPLSLQRAQAVVKVLTERFGVPASQLTPVDGKGGVKNHKNITLDRTVIIEK